MSDQRFRFSRRGFLEATGFALFVSALEGCGRAPRQMAMAPVRQVEGAIPGKSNDYGIVCGGCNAVCGVLAKNRDGRPIKLEGNPEHPVTRGGLCATGQAALLSLYDSQRLVKPRLDGKDSEWGTVDTMIVAALEKIRGGEGTVRILTDTIVSPTRQAKIDEFLAQFEDGQHVSYDPLSCSAILDAHEQTHGARVLPRYRFDKASVVVSFDADFLGTWISPVQFAADYQAGRVPQGEPPEMSYHVQFEARMSLTGSNADWRETLLPGETGRVIRHLAKLLAEKAGNKVPEGTLDESPVETKSIEDLADRLWHAKGKSLVVCGSQDKATQVVCNFVNELLDSYGNTLDIQNPSNQKQGNDQALASLLDAIKAGKVNALFIAGVNPVYELPMGSQLAERFKQIPLVVSFSEQDDETSAACKVVCPEGHWLEQWSDAEPVSGVVSVAQPAIRPLGDTRSLISSLTVWMGQAPNDFRAVQDYWKNHLYGRRQNEETSFQAFWDVAVHDGFATLKTEAAETSFTAPETLVTSMAGAGDRQLELILYPKVSLLAGRHANNPWLQELPDPISKATWDNYVCIATRKAAELGIRTGDVVRVKAGDAEPVELPALVQPGQHERSIAIALGYGRRGTDRFERIGPPWIEARRTTGPNGRVGTNVAPLLHWTNGQLRYDGLSVEVEKTRQRVPLARTQKYDWLELPDDVKLRGGERRHNVEQTTLEAYRENPIAGHHAPHEFEELWPDDHPYTGHHWGLIVDLNKCTGCSACAISCQAENNVPVVGRDEIRRNREMHWIRIDRYYTGEDDNVDVVYQPMMCHHCDHAPCETVCPVIATAHSEEGLNQQIYNRCVGTRYCANNCPYKVRRFNWFNYAHPDEIQNLALNPDVTVRTRGVMEKCSFCVQRIQDAKLEAKRTGVPLSDGDVQTACQQSCPSSAIVFGDLNDPESAVSKAAKMPRCFQVLAELNVRPTVGYLRVVRHREGGEEPVHHV
ncbi:MAG: 4Fe-4S dicluster domain-containing protein [Pirellulaceae bacterium]